MSDYRGVLMIPQTVTQYEQAFAGRFGAPAAFAFWKGRVALYAILKGLGIGPGDEVILPGYTCVMAVNPILYLGARAVFVDIEPATFNLDPVLVERAITPATKLIIAQHTYGYPVNMGAIMEIAGRHGIRVIEDCCLAFGSRYAGRTCGTFGAAAYFSFQWNKPYTSGLGGMALVNDRELAERIAAIREREVVQPGGREVNMLRAQLAVYRTVIYPQTTALAQNVFRMLTKAGVVVGSSSTAEFTPSPEPDFFKGMSPLQARAGLRQLGKVDAGVAHRRRLTELYRSLLAERGFAVPALPAEMDPVLVRYPVRVADKAKALAEASRHFLELGSWFECPLHPIETPMEQYGYHDGLCPQADRASRETVNLPLHRRCSEAVARKGVEFLASIGPAPAA